MAKTPAPDRAEHPTHRYARSVVAGEIPAGKYIRLACERHLRDLEHGHARGLYFDAKAANRTFRLYERVLRHYKGEHAGQPFKLELWQKFGLGCIYGWKRADGTRRFRQALWLVPRKNGKSTTAAGVGIKALIDDDEPGAEVYSAATKKDQAKIVWNTAVKMIQRAPMLAGSVQVYANSLVYAEQDSSFLPLGADADTLDGLDVHTAVIDELHAHRNRKALDVIDTGTGARRQPLLFIITTAGDDPAGVLTEQVDYARQVLEGVLEDDTLFALLYMLDEGDDWADPKVWAKCNPNLGVSQTVADLERKAVKARAVRGDQASFRQKHLNDMHERLNRAIDVELWKTNGAPFEEAALAGRLAFGGLDLSSKRDLSSFQVLVPPEDLNGVWHVVTRLYMPEDNIDERAREDRAPYRQWQRDGFLTATPGNVIDYEFIERDVLAAADAYDLHEVGFDPYNATGTATRLIGEGISMVEVRQGAKSMGGPTREFLEVLLPARRLNHGNHPGLTWMASNFTIRKDANDNWMPDKATATRRIDGIVATIIALARAQVYLNDADDGRTVYDDGAEVLVI